MRIATERQSEHEYREFAIEELVVNADMEIAPLLIQHEIEHMEERREEMMKRLGISEDDYNRFTGRTAEEIRDEMHEEAVEKLNRSHAISAFIEQEALEISDDDFNDRLTQLAREGDESTGRKLTNKELRSERVKSSIRESLLIEKALDRLVQIAKGQADERIRRRTRPARKTSRRSWRSQRPRPVVHCEEVGRMKRFSVFGTIHNEEIHLLTSTFQNAAPTVVETNAKGRKEEYNIYSLLLRKRIIFLGSAIDDQVANCRRGSASLPRRRGSLSPTFSCTSTLPAA